MFDNIEAPPTKFDDISDGLEEMALLIAGIQQLGTLGEPGNPIQACHARTCLARAAVVLSNLEHANFELSQRYQGGGEVV